jgi:hypothetical protein
LTKIPPEISQLVTIAVLLTLERLIAPITVTATCASAVLAEELGEPPTDEDTTDSPQLIAMGNGAAAEERR